MKGWKGFDDGHVQFISENVWDDRVPGEIVARLRPNKSKSQQRIRKVIDANSDQVKICAIPADAAHPAAGQFGLFAAQTLHPSEHIIDYLGFVTLEELCEESEYVASLDSGVLINAEKHGNEARFINDFHGTGSMPNVRFQTRTDENGERRLGVHVLKRKIRKGEELLITYGWGYALG